MERYLVILTLVCGSLSISMGGERNYSVSEKENSVELSTPWGKKSIIQDFNPSTTSSYIVSIPIDALKSTVPPQPTPEVKPEDKTADAKDGKATRNLTATGKDDEWDDDITDEYEDDLDDDDYDDDRRPSRRDRELASLQPIYDDTDKLVLDANRLFNRRRYYEASAVVEEILRKRPEYARAWIMKGSLMKVQGHSDLAKNAWEKALTLDPNNRELQSLLGRKP